MERLRVGIVVLDAAPGRIERNVEVVVERGAERGDPGEGPSHATFERFDLLPWRAGYRGEGGISCGEMDDRAGEVIGEVRAVFAALLPVRIEHEVIDDELPMTSEEIAQRRLPLRALEDVLVLDLDHRKAPAFRGERITLSTPFLLPDQQLFARLEPFRSRYDDWSLHHTLRVLFCRSFWTSSPEQPVDSERSQTATGTHTRHNERHACQTSRTHCASPLYINVDRRHLESTRL